jgi:hypothetical protein
MRKEYFVMYENNTCYFCHENDIKQAPVITDELLAKSVANMVKDAMKIQPNIELHSLTGRYFIWINRPNGVLSIDQAIKPDEYTAKKELEKKLKHT